MRPLLYPKFAISPKNWYTKDSIGGKTMRVITNDMIVNMNEMYSEGKSCKTIANTLNISPYTVKKYIKDYKEKEPEKIIYNKSLPNFNSKIFRNKDWGELCELNEEEIDGIRKLWEEIEF